VKYQYSNTDIRCNIAESCVQTRFRFGGMFNEYLLQIYFWVPLNEVLKSVNIWWSYYEHFVACFLMPLLEVPGDCRLELDSWRQ